MRVEAVPVWAVGLALVAALLAAWLVSAVARFLLRGRARLGTATSIVIAMLGTAVGLILTGWLSPASAVYGPLAIGLSLGVSVVFMAAYAAIAAHFQQPQRATLAELVAAGESSRVEFKSTARVNLHTGKRDDKMEQVVAKTVAAFLNADGGSLVIGVDDAGTPLGLASDFATIKAPDADRFELWLRDFLTTTLGQNAAALVDVDFAEWPPPSSVGRKGRSPAGSQPGPRRVRSTCAARARRPSCGSAPATRRASSASTRRPNT